MGGVEAFLAIWRALPRYRWLARLVSLPGLRGVVEVVYERFLAPWLYRRHMRRQARRARA